MEPPTTNNPYEIPQLLRDRYGISSFDQDSATTSPSSWTTTTTREIPKASKENMYSSGSSPYSQESSLYSGGSGSYPTHDSHSHTNGFLPIPLYSPLSTPYVVEGIVTAPMVTDAAYVRAFNATQDFCHDWFRCIDTENGSVATGSVHNGGTTIQYKYTNQCLCPTVGDLLCSQLVQSDEDRQCVGLIGAVHPMDGDAMLCLLEHMEHLVETVQTDGDARGRLDCFVVWIFGYISMGHDGQLASSEPLKSNEAPRVLAAERRERWRTLLPRAKLCYIHFGGFVRVDESARKFVSITHAISRSLMVMQTVHSLALKMAREAVPLVAAEPRTPYRNGDDDDTNTALDEERGWFGRLVDRMSTGIVFSFGAFRHRELQVRQMNNLMMSAFVSTEWNDIRNLSEFLQRHLQQSLMTTPGTMTPIDSSLYNPSQSILESNIMSVRQQQERERQVQLLQQRYLESHGVSVVESPSYFRALFKRFCI